MDLFDFAPDSNVPETLPREAPQTAMTMNGWQFAARPTAPYQRKFKITLYGIRWYTNERSGFYDLTTNPKHNARLLEMFYESHETWSPFLFKHQHFGETPIQCRFASPLTVPAGEMNSGGLIKSVEVNLIQHNPGY